MKSIVPFLSSPVIIVLMIMSVYSLALVLYQIFRLQVAKENLPDLLAFIEDEKKSNEQLAGFAAEKDTPHRRLIAIWLDHGGKSVEAKAAVLSDEARMLRWETERRQAPLGTIANVAPFVGLFGTVIGVIRAFHSISVKMGAGPSVVAAGISEALIATAAGLFVAVPAVVFFNFFLKKTRSLGFELERVATALTNREGGNR